MNDTVKSPGLWKTAALLLCLSLLLAGLAGCSSAAKLKDGTYREMCIRDSADGSCSYIYGQNVFAGDRCYDGGGKLWVAQKDMLPCTWPPAAGNEWKEAVADET